MKTNRVYGVLLIVANVLLIVMICVLSQRMDKKPPKIEFEGSSQAEYEPGMDESLLKEGVRATDDRDGDISQRVVVEKIVENTDNTSVTVYYAASDRAGNVVRASRVFALSEEKESEAYYGNRILH